jgi:hypothetical protein
VGSIFDRTLSSSDFRSLVRPALMRALQATWDSADTGKDDLNGVVVSNADC